MALKTKWKAYVLWLVGGFFGLHQFYLERDVQAFVTWCTLGGFFGIGWIRDFWKIPQYVAEANNEKDYVQKLIEKMQKHQKPPFSLTLFLGQIITAYFFGIAYFWSIPVEDIYGWDLKFLRLLTPFPLTFGIWLIGNTGSIKGRFKPPLVSAAISYGLSYSNMPSNLTWCCLSAAIGFNSKSKEWMRTPKLKKTFLKRISVLLIGATIYLALIGLGLYFNAEITDKNGETVKFREAARNLIDSPLWEEFKDKLVMMYNYYQAYGWQNVYQDIIDQLDPQGERRALKTLGLPDTATKPEIVAKFRALSKEWHPDRHKDPEKKQEAHSKFMEYQDAYQKLIKIRGKVKAATTYRDDDNLKSS
ncbi:hypothetical protein CHUAL_013798 [Chamberlinius hualienensis]